MMEEIQYIQPATRWLACPSKECCHIGDSVLTSSISSLGIQNSSSQDSFLKGKSMLLSPCSFHSYGHIVHEPIKQALKWLMKGHKFAPES